MSRPNPLVGRPAITEPTRKGQSRHQGAAAEDEALKYLEQRGLELVARNFSSKVGELDLIMKEESGTLVFVEVRMRVSGRFGGAAASVQRPKQRRVIRAAQAFLRKQTQWRESPCRFDIVAIDGPAHEIEWIQGAFDAG